MGNDNPNAKPEKNEAPTSTDGLSWGKSLKIAGLGTASTAAGIGVAFGIGAAVKKAFSREVSHQGARQAAAFGGRVLSVFGKR